MPYCVSLRCCPLFIRQAIQDVAAIFNISIIFCITSLIFGNTTDGSYVVYHHYVCHSMSATHSYDGAKDEILVILRLWLAMGLRFVDTILLEVHCMCAL